MTMFYFKIYNKYCTLLYSKKGTQSFKSLFSIFPITCSNQPLPQHILNAYLCNCTAKDIAHVKFHIPQRTQLIQNFPQIIALHEQFIVVIRRFHKMSLKTARKNWLCIGQTFHQNETNTFSQITTGSVSHLVIVISTQLFIGRLG